MRPVFLLGLVLSVSFFRLGAAELRRDVEYARATGTALLLDASIPEGKGPFPVAILIHGGGWDSGDKSGSNVPGNGADISPWFEPLTAARFTWFSINYRPSTQQRWPACLEDVQTAIRWVKAHAHEFKGDPQRIALFGHSAGGQLACQAALIAGDDTRVQAVVGFAPVTDLEQDAKNRDGLSTSLQRLFGQPKEINDTSRALLRAHSPINHVTPAAPPFLLVHGDADKTVPIQQSLDFQARLKAAGVPCDLMVIPGAPHGLLKWEQFSPDYATHMVDWLRKTLAQSPGKGP